MIERTVVGWDGSDGAADALDWALARPTTEKLHLVRVDNGVALAETFAADSPAAAARIDLMEKADGLRQEHPDRTISSELLQGDVAETLAALASPSSLVVVGTRQSSGRRPRRGWSVGARVAGHASGPVAIIPRSSVPGGTSVVVGVDEPEEGALLFAAEEAVRTGSTLRPVRAWQAAPLWPGQTEHDPEYLESLATMYADLVTDALEGILERYPDILVDPVIKQGDPVEVLQEAARGAALLVVGNRGFRGFRRFFIGSVSQAVVLSADVPTVVVSGATAT